MRYRDKKKLLAEINVVPYIDVMLVLLLVVGSIIGVQIGQKVGEQIDSSGLKALLAILLLIVGLSLIHI